MSTANQPSVIVDESALGEDLTQQLIWEIVGTHEYIKIKRKDGDEELLGPGDVAVANKISEDAYSTRARFWEKVEKRGKHECWEWQACTDWYGYGRFWLSEHETSEAAHRVSFRMNQGPIPARLQVNHVCDNPVCVNPAHLYLGTQSENMLDAYKRGRRDQQNGTDMPHGFSEDEVHEIRRIYEEEDVSYSDLAERFDVGSTTIGQLIRGETYSDV